MPAHLFGWSTQQEKIELPVFVREVNVRMRQLWHDFESGKAIALVGRANTFTALQTISATSAGSLLVGSGAISGSNYVFGINGTFDGTARDLIALTGTMDGAGNPRAISSYPTFTASANTQLLVGIGSGAIVAKGAYTGLDYRGFHAFDPTTSGAGTIATAYGIYVDAITVGTANLSIYAGGAVSFATTCTVGTAVNAPILQSGAATDLLLKYNTTTKITVGTALTTFADPVTVTGDVTLGTAGNGVRIKEGSNATLGVATLTAGTVTVSTTKAVTGSRIFLQRQASGGTIGTAITYTISNGTSFAINSDNPLDTSTFNWLIITPA